MLKSNLKDSLEFSEKAIEEQEEMFLKILLNAEYELGGKGSASKEETLYKSIKRGDKKATEELLQTSPELLNKVIFNGLTPLAIAIDHNQAEIVTLLLKYGVSLKTGHNLYADAETYARFSGELHLVTLIQQYRQQSDKRMEEKDSSVILISTRNKDEPIISSPSIVSGLTGMDDTNEYLTLSVKNASIEASEASIKSDKLTDAVARNDIAKVKRLLLETYRHCCENWLDAIIRFC